MKTELPVLKKLSPAFTKAFTCSVPIFVAYFPLGVVFGLVFENQGYYWLLGPVMSLLVYGGAVQFLALAMLEQGEGLLQILIACLFIAIRNSFYGTSFFARFAKFSLISRIYMIFSLVDATYALLLTPSAVAEQDDEKYCLCLAVLIHIYWVAGTLVGAGFGSVIPQIKGLQFVLSILFVIFTLDQYFKHKKLWPFIVAAISWVVMQAVAPHYALVGAITLATICAVFVVKRGQVDVS